MLSKPDRCKGCPLWGNGKGWSEIEGTGSLGVALVGEALGASEEWDGLPFRPYADAGSVLERALRLAGLSRSQFFLTNAIRCRPPQNRLEGEPYEAEALARCRSYLNEFVETHRPKAMVALGSVATRVLTGMAGQRQGVSMIRGYVLDSPYRIPIIPTFHPSFLRRGAMHLLGVMIRDIQLAVRIAHSPLSRPETHYLEYPSLSQAEEFLEEVRSHPDLPLAFDIETGELGEEEEKSGQVVQIQFSLRPGEAIVFPWTEPFARIAGEILRLDNPKLGFNSWQFDVPILGANGIEVRGESHDLMWCWHHMQPDLPRNLQFVTSFFAPEMRPWKHLSGEDLAGYGAADVDALQRIWTRLPEDMRAKGVWRGYERHVRGLWPILDRMSRRGLPINEQERLELGKELDERLVQLEGELDRLYPNELKEPKPKNGYLRTPSFTEGLTLRIFPNQKVVKRCGCVGELRAGKRRVRVAEADCRECGGAGVVEKVEDVERWCRLEPFRPSQKQLIRYMRWRGHKIPLIPGEEKETTGKLGLEQLAKKTKDPLYQKVLEHRGVQKIKSAYVDAWKPGEDGCVHATYTFSPATGQLAAKNPNVLTTPTEKIGELGVRFQRIVHAHPGRLLVEFDYHAFHSVTLAFEAQDPDFMRIAQMDAHSFLAARMLRLKEPEEMLAMEDGELEEFLAWVKRNHGMVRNKKAKPAILGIGFGLGARKLHELNPGSFESVREAQGVIDTLKALFHRVARYQDSVRMLAHKQRFLLNRHGYIRWFWDVYHYQNGRLVPGEDSEAAIAFNPACDAHGHMKDVVLRLAERGLDERYGLCNIVHDALVFHCLEERVEECVEVVRGEMEKPSETLVDPVVAPKGLVVRVDVKVGPDKARMSAPLRGQSGKPSPEMR